MYKQFLTSVIFSIIGLNCPDISPNKIENFRNDPIDSIKILSETEASNFFILEENLNHSGTDASISKISDGKNIYILKQIADESLQEQFLLVNDCIASTIGCHVGVNVNRVIFVPYDVGQKLKIFPDRAATLHSYISGKNLEDDPAQLPKDFSIHQRVINPNSQWQKKYPLASNRQGLTKNHIKNMSIHKDLAPIVALDTFVGNCDRSLPNIFYDQLGDRFYGIDQAAAFTNNLANHACERIKELSAKKYFNKCSPKIIDGLKKYRSILAELQGQFEPAFIIQIMKKLSTFLGKEATSDLEILERIKRESAVIKDNHNYSAQLTNLLDQFLVSSPH